MRPRSLHTRVVRLPKERHGLVFAEARARLVLSCAVVLATFGCSEKDAAKCAEAQKVMQKAIDVGDFALARQWREYAYKQCEDAASLAGADQQLVNREATSKAEAERAAKRKAETAGLVKLFVDFVAQNRAAPDRASATPSCEEPAATTGTPAKAGKEKERFCTGTRNAGTFALSVRYWEADPSAFRFTTTPPDAVDCAALGGTVEKSWGVPAVGGKTAVRSRCALAGPLAGLTAVVSGAQNADVMVFSPTYVEKDPSARTILEGP